MIVWLWLICTIAWSWNIWDLIRSRSRRLLSWPRPKLPRPRPVKWVSGPTWDQDVSRDLACHVTSLTCLGHARLSTLKVTQLVMMQWTWSVTDSPLVTVHTCKACVILLCKPSIDRSSLPIYCTYPMLGGLHKSFTNASNRHWINGFLRHSFS